MTDTAREKAWTEYVLEYDAPFTEAVKAGFNAAWELSAQAERERIAVAIEAHFLVSQLQTDWDVGMKYAAAIARGIDSAPADDDGRAL